MRAVVGSHPLLVAGCGWVKVCVDVWLDGWVMVRSYRVRGKPRSTAEVAGSGQREVTTLPRV